MSPSVATRATSRSAQALGEEGSGMAAADSRRSETFPPAISLGAGGGGFGRGAASVGLARAMPCEMR